MVLMNTNTNSKNALYFLTEQACCLAQNQGVETEHFHVCRETAEYLADGNTDIIKAFDERTGSVKRDFTGQEDYITENYEGKRDDVRAAVVELTNLSKNTNTPDDKRGATTAAAYLIASFYGMDGVLEEYPA
jgi:hypothetical protein